jgi:hypothetical protein
MLLTLSSLTRFSPTGTALARKTGKKKSFSLSLVNFFSMCLSCKS